MELDSVVLILMMVQRILIDELIMDLASINYLRNQGGKKFDYSDLDEARKFYKGNYRGS